ncbi:ATP-dependent helicase SGS1 [Zancudomyces culisetae]|uniref:ATP-dependent helicase SGS1 n=1 Tax=Zancudomyces culisetae TaxID=1213189 RepID=A0A1R1PZ80_ZANCU|nr:ATP-dependent helicase SGS1 [Zancudomyces culisetae]|eukprot:OMH86268.1 ATP-dependent helicase SGS1 [Zancudomyces culisetae]
MRTCDNCRENVNKEIISLDVTQHAKNILQLLENLLESHKRITLVYASSVYCGSKMRKILDLGDNRLPQYGMGSSEKRSDIERIFHYLVSIKAIAEYCEAVYMGSVATYIKPGPLADRILSGSQAVVLKTSNSPTKNQKDTESSTNKNNKQRKKRKSTKPHAPASHSKSIRRSFDSQSLAGYAYQDSGNSIVVADTDTVSPHFGSSNTSSLSQRNTRRTSAPSSTANTGTSKRSTTKRNDGGNQFYNSAIKPMAI